MGATNNTGGVVGSYGSNNFGGLGYRDGSGNVWGVYTPANAFIGGNLTTGNIVRLNGVTTSFPSAQGAANTVLSNDGSGNLSWAAPSALSPIATSTSVAYTTVGTSWTNYSGGSVSITVPGPGTIVVEANTWMMLDHTNGTLTRLYLAIGTSATDGGNATDWVAWDIPAAMPTLAESNYTFTVRNLFTVSSAGTYTYYLNGMMASGASANDQFYFDRMIATFH
jgi:hypothetical protein